MVASQPFANHWLTVLKKNQFMVTFPTLAKRWHKVGSSTLVGQPFTNHLQTILGDWLEGQCWQFTANVGDHCQTWPNGRLLSGKQSWRLSCQSSNRHCIQFWYWLRHQQQFDLFPMSYIKTTRSQLNISYVPETLNSIIWKKLYKQLASIQKSGKYLGLCGLYDSLYHQTPDISHSFTSTFQGNISDLVWEDFMWISYVCGCSRFYKAWHAVMYD